MTASPAQFPASPDSDAGGVRASDADRDEAAAELGEHYAAGRLTHTTFQHRMEAVMGARRRAELPPLLADLPPRPRPRPGLAARWERVKEEAGALARSVRDGLGVTGSFAATPGRPGVLVPGPRPAPAPLPFPRGSGMLFTIGRDGDCDLALEDPTVSRSHAILQRSIEPGDGTWLLTDEDSTNGTRVNGWRVRGTVPVRAGDVVRFGDAEYTLVPSGD